MPGAWEIQPNVLVAMIHTEATTIAWSLGLRRLVVPGLLQEPIAVAGQPYDHARNTCCMRMLEIGADYIFFLDTDVIPPKDTIPRLLAHKKPFISGLYYRRSPPQGIPVMMAPIGQWVTNFPKGKVIEVDVVGAGCMLVRRDVIQNCPPQRPGYHWFDWRVNLKGHSQEPLSEDFTFCRHIRRTMNIPILVDTSIECRHVGHGEATHNKFEPLNCA